MRFTSATRIFIGTSLHAIGSVAYAQTAPAADAGAPPASGEIVVTAQRRAESVTTVPISITVANQAQLERQQVNTINDLSRIAPSLEIQAAPGQNTGGGGYIRGIGTQTFGAGSVASVGLVVDQVSQGNVNIGDLFDIARVEVLKGPQGTLFGLTTSAGVINITTNAPDPSAFTARIRSELSGASVGSEFGNQIVQGVVNVPLSSDAALRVAGTGNFRQGPDRNTVTGDRNGIDHYGGRARLLWRPTSDLTVNLIGDWTRSTAENGGDFFTFVKTGGPDLVFGQIPDQSGITARLESCGVTPGEGNKDYCTTRSFKERNTNFGGSAEIDYDAGPVTLTEIAAYRENQDRGFGAASDVFRADPLILQVANGPVHRNLRLFTNEFRISSPANQFFEYTIGTFFSHQKETRAPESLAVTASPFPGLTIPVVNSIGQSEAITDDSLAVFGQGTFHLTPKLRLIGGGRYTSEKLELDDVNYDLGGLYTHQQISPTKVSWRFGAQYDIARRTMVYATVSRGYKGGQIAIPSLPTLPYVVQPEIPTAYEVGLKSTLFGGWVMDINAFYENIHGFQAQQCIVDGNGVISCTVSNINGVKTRGAEINFFGKVFRGLTLNTGFIMAKATYPKGFVGNDGADIGGTQLAYAPRYKFTLSGEYEHDLGSSFKGFVGADTVWKSRIRYEQNSVRDTTFRPHWMVGTRIGVRTADDRYSLAVFGRNLFNVHEPVLMQSAFPYNDTDAQGKVTNYNVGAIYGPQSFRQIGLQLEAKF